MAVHDVMQEGRAAAVAPADAVTATELADLLGGSVAGDGERELTGVAPVEEAGPRDVTFVTDERYLEALRGGKPGAVLLPYDFDVSDLPPDAAVIRVRDPQLAFARAVRVFHAEPEFPTGVHETALLASDVELGAEVSVGPYAVMESGARVGRGTRIGAFTLVGRGVRIGEDCVIAEGCSLQRGTRVGDRVILHPGVRLATEGYGYLHPDGGRAVKMPQVGGCLVEDDVEIGANSTIDRGTVGDTVVGARTKVDNLVHVGHNVRIGPDCMIVAQVGIAGSTRLGEGVQLGGQAGISGHLTIGDGARVAAQAGVIGDVPAGETYSGYPARPHGRAMRASAALYRYPELLRRIRALERRLDELAAAEEG